MSGTNEALNLCAIIISFLALLVAVAALGISLGLKWSTHKIEFKPLEFDEFEDKEDEEIDEDEILQAALKLQRKKKIEDPLEDITKTSNF